MITICEEMLERYGTYKDVLNTYPPLLTPLEVYESQGSKKLDVLESVTWSVLAPCINTFTLWVVQQALRKEIKRLYFLARDGYLMYRIAEKLVETFQLPLTCHYLYCSRYSLRTPLFHLDIDAALDYICRNSIVVNLHVILKRTGLDKAQQNLVLACLDLDLRPDEEIPYARLKDVREALKKNQVFLQCLEVSSKEMLPNLMGYLGQAGLLDDVESAIVDSGWTGSTQKSLNQALRQGGRTKDIKGFYWGLYTIPVGAKAADYSCYYFSPTKGIEEKISFSNSLFEGVFSAAHGMTIGYGDAETGYHPFYLSIDDEKKEFQNKIKQVVLAYTALLIDAFRQDMDFDCTEAKKPLYRSLKIFMATPTKAEVVCFGRITFSDDVFEDYAQCIAAELNEKELAANGICNKIVTMLGVKKSKIKESAWHEGSIVRIGKKEKYYLWQYRFYKRLLYMRTTVMWRLKNGKV
ncbi:MAG: hypothetical protein FWE25_03915 [Lachnospiraceae bacterium]|nr:hypothetical protein [Lachnospiraceae bacterium]